MNPGIVLVVAAVAAVAVAACLLLTISNEKGHADDGGYLYVLYTDTDCNVDVIDVYESHSENGVRTPLAQRYRTSDTVDGMNGFWSFDGKTGIGPFDSFYAAVNILDDCPAYDADDGTQKRSSVAAGGIGYVLDPYDLSRTLDGSPYTRELYDTMLIVPTVYWTSGRVVASESSGNLVAGTEYDVLYMSSSPSYKVPGGMSVEGMVAYAHSASTGQGSGDSRTTVYPHLALGVYESYASSDTDAVGGGRLLSQSGRTPASNLDVDEFKALADSGLQSGTHEGPRTTCQQWNFYQWTLYKMMCYTVMGSKNSQVMVGKGYTDGNDGCAVTGSTDRIGMAGTAPVTVSDKGTATSEPGKTAAKLFLENGWGSLNEFIGDAYVAGDTAKTQILYAGNRLGGDPLLDGRVQPSTSHVWADVVTDNHHVIESTSYDPSTWDAPLTAFGERTYDDAGSVGDIVNSRASGVSSLTAGGRWNNTHYSGVAFICAGYDIALANEYRGARLAMLMP